ncbi:MAG: hypothetical protein AAF539_16830, partial [Planctomycetota bacterium]
MRRCLVVVAAITSMWIAPVQAQISIELDVEAPPILYSDTPPDNRVSRLIDQIRNDEIRLTYNRPHGYLRSLLGALEIPESSQTL